MKKIFIAILVILFPFSFALSQQVEVESAIRNSQNIYQGSARFMGMGGAFTALGGDISSISVNPAGVGVYTGMQFVLTPSFQTQDMSSTTTYGGSTFEEDALNYKVNLNNLGLMSSYNLKGSVGWKNINIGLGYNTLHNFDRKVEASHFNPDRSKLHEWVNNANRIDPYPPEPETELPAAYEYLAWQTYLINYQDTLDTQEYWSYVTDEMNYSDTAGTGMLGVNQRKTINNGGNLGEYFIAAGANYNNKLYVGLSIGIQRYKFTYKSTYSESEDNNQIPDFSSMSFIQHEDHSGTGYNFKVGAIYRPVDFVRIGAAFHSPTYFSNLEYGWYNQMTGNYDNGDNLTSQSEESTFSYKLTTPSKLVGGVAFKIANIGMISADYERLDYGNTQLIENQQDVPFDYENDSIQSTYGVANNLRLGGELKLNSFYVRL
ncbi:MAG: hypothetical protein KGY60_11680, partial [Bacteroidales bacterium]|nr:hypothetical protein [Bacteroidales bacterium]